MNSNKSLRESRVFENRLHNSVAEWASPLFVLATTNIQSALTILLENKQASRAHTFVGAGESSTAAFLQNTPRLSMATIGSVIFFSVRNSSIARRQSSKE